LRQNKLQLQQEKEALEQKKLKQIQSKEMKEQQRKEKFQRKIQSNETTLSREIFNHIQKKYSSFIEEPILSKIPEFFKESELSEKHQTAIMEKHLYFKILGPILNLKKYIGQTNQNLKLHFSSMILKMKRFTSTKVVFLMIFLLKLLKAQKFMLK
jgi:hypothetical protein